MGLSEGEAREKREEKVFEEILTESFPNVADTLVYRSKKLKAIHT